MTVLGLLLATFALCALGDDRIARAFDACVVGILAVVCWPAVVVLGRVDA